MIKRVFAIAIVIIFALGTQASSVFSESSSDLYSEDWRFAYNVLSALGIVEYSESDVGADKLFTRGEMAAVVTKLNKIDKINFSAQTFTDVSSTHKYKDYINAAVYTGIFNGFQDGSFHPDEPITNLQMAKVLVALLGYDVLAETKGGFPTGYLIQASELKLNIDNSQIPRPMTFSDAMLVIYRALDVDVLTKTVFGNTQKYEAHPGQNLIYKKLNIVKSVGKVTANAKTSLSSTIGVARGTVTIGSVTYKEGNTNAGDYLGYNVEYYYEYSDDNRLLFAAPKSNKNSTIEIMSKDIESAYITNTGAIEISYLNVFKQTRRISIPQSADFIYNGVRVPKDSSLLLFTEKVGNIVLVGCDGGDYDTIFVNAYESSPVESVSNSNNTIYLKHPTSQMPDSSLNIDSFEKPEDIQILLNEKSISIKDLKEWDIISVAKSLDGRFANVLVSRTEMTGTIEEKNSDGTVVFDGQALDLEEAFINSDEFKRIFVGDRLTLYFNTFGYVVACDRNKKIESKFAYVVETSKDDGLSGEVSIKLFCDNGSMSIYKLAKKVKNNNVTFLADEFLNISGLVEYKLNSDNRVIALNTPTSDGTLRLGHADKQTLKYLWASESFDTKVYLDQNTLVIIVPDGKAADKRYQVLSRRSYFGVEDANKSFKISSYNEDKFRVAQILVVYEPIDQTKIEIARDENSFVVDKVTSVIVGDEIRSKIYGYYNKKAVNYLVDDSISINDLKQGDLLQVRLNSLNEIVGYYKLFSQQILDTEQYSNVSSTDKDRVAVWGEVVNIDATRKRLSVSDVYGEKFFNLAVTKAIYLYERNRKTIKPAQISDIEPHDLIAIRVRYARAYEILIIRD